MLDPMLMHNLAAMHPVAAIGYSLIWLLLGGGPIGAIIIFFIARGFGK